MTYREIIQEAKNKLDTLDNLVDDYVDTTDLALSFGIWTSMNPTDRLKSVYVKVHYCTDTWVGESVIFLDGEAVGVSKQTSRKGDKTYYFTSEEAANKLYKLLFSLSIVETVPVYVDLDAEIDDYYGVDFSGEILHKHGYVLNDSTGRLELVKINDTYTIYNMISETVNITYIGRNVTEDIDVTLLRFKYNQSLG